MESAHGINMAKSSIQTIFVSGAAAGAAFYWHHFLASENRCSTVTLTQIKPTSCAGQYRR
jgi:hypothetical protein